MTRNRIQLGNFIHWDWGENYPFSACMKKLMECLGGDPGRYNDCVSVCEDTETFLARTFGRIGLAYELALPAQWRQDPESLKEKLRSFIDRGIPVLAKDAYPKGGNFDLVFRYRGLGQQV